MKPSRSLFPGQATPVDPPELAETVLNALGTFGLPLPQSPSSAGFAYRDDCRSSLTFARHVMFEEDIADAINGVRYVTSSVLHFLLTFTFTGLLLSQFLNMLLCNSARASSDFRSDQAAAGAG
jgi:hypothetical protein